MTDNILEQNFEQPLRASVKINFLTKQKEHLNELIKDLNQNMRINKKIINQLSKSIQTNVSEHKKLRKFNQIVDLLIKQNERLSNRNEELIQDLQSLKCNTLIHDQIKQEQQFQYYTVIKQYEDKILELRRSIQDKQYIIQQKESIKYKIDETKKRQTIADPKHETIKLLIDLDQLKDLTRKLTRENNQLKKKNSELQLSVNQKQLKIQKIDALLKSQVNYHTVKSLYINKRSLSEQKICFGNSNFKSSKIDQKKPNQYNKFKQQNAKKSKYMTVNNNKNDNLYIKNENLSLLRQCYFKQKQTSEALIKKFSELNINYSNIVNTNKLLTQSNMNYQIKRSKLQAQLNFYKRKNQELLSIIMKRKIKLNKSLTKLPSDQVIKEIKIDNEIQHNLKETIKCLDSMKEEVEQSTRSLSKIITRNYFKKIREKKRINNSFSCPNDYFPKQQVDGVEQFIKKQQLKHKKKEQDRQRDQAPFLVDFSVIKPQKAPISFADYKNSFKKKKVSESFIQISQQILRF